MEKDLPVCPVEMTLMLISDRWKVLIIRDKALWGIEEIRGQCLPEGFDRESALHGGERPAHPEGICGGASPGGIYFNGDRIQPETDLDAMVAWGLEYKASHSGKRD